MATSWAFRAAIALALPVPAGRADEGLELFERQIRPVLVNQCLPCHGPQRQESGLRLDSRAAVLQGGDRGPSVDPSSPAQSLLVQALRQDGDLSMPPDGTLSESQVAAFSIWIRQGLPWPAAGREMKILANRRPEHWAFQPVRRPRLPSGQLGATPVDQFVVAKLRARGLRLSEPADRLTFIRRVTLGLTGLPPTPSEISDFLQDEQIGAKSRLIDRLLASPRYGERWARHWLDVARYGDNKGYVFFEDKQYPWAYTYRDYVIRAFNSDLPYDRFVLEQLAADQLELGTDRRPLTALGFLTLGGHFMNNTHDIIDDRIDVVTRGLLALTVTCARCHDHKYDPLTQADYYALYGVFRSCYEPLVPPLFEPPPETPAYRDFAAEMSKREQALVQFVTDKHATLVADARTRIAAYLLAANARRGQPPTDDFMLLADKGDLNPSMILRWQSYLDDPSVDADVWGPWRRLAGLPVAEFAAQAPSVLRQLSVNTPTGERPINELVRRTIAETPPRNMAETAKRYEALLHSVDQQWQSLLRKAKRARRPPPQRLADASAERLRQVLYGPSVPAQAPLVMDWGFLSLFPDRATQNEYKKLLKAVEQWSTSEPAAPARAMVLWDAPVPHQPRIFQRGNPNRVGPKVPRRFPTLLAAHERPFTQGSGRLELAAAIVDSANPLTARVFVNRLWLHHFGRGLVSTPSDFGFRSEPPTHAKLLDYLASELIDNGWSVKHLQRLILNSAVYQQSSSRSRSGSADPLLIDPENRLWWTRKRQRLEFEPLRDSLLAVSGQLETTMFGRPSQLFGAGEQAPRRSIYGFIDRLDVPSLLTTFDFPSPAASSPQRAATTVPPQALFFMNGGLAQAAARQLVDRPDVRALSKLDEKVSRIYLLVFGRKPAPAERTWAREFLGPRPTVKAWTTYCHSLLMTNEFAFVD